MASSRTKTVKEVGYGSAKVRVVHISDTHNQHRAISLPRGDVLVHTGDFLDRHDSRKEREAMLDDFNAWLGEVADAFPTRVVVLGNHDITAHGSDADGLRSRLSNATHYLQNTGAILPCGLSIWGSPNTSAPPSHAFGTPRRKTRSKLWNMIPAGTDVVATHMPPRCILDLAWKRGADSGSYACGECGESHSNAYSHWGDEALRKTVLSRVKPALHLFGHVHDHVGVTVRTCTSDSDDDGDGDNQTHSDQPDTVVFINSSFDLEHKVHLVHLFFDPKPLDALLITAIPSSSSSSSGTTFTLRNAIDGRVLDVDRSEAEPGTPVILWKQKKNATNQQWQLSNPISDPDGTLIISALDPSLSLGLSPDLVLALTPTEEAPLWTLYSSILIHTPTASPVILSPSTEYSLSLSP